MAQRAADKEQTGWAGPASAGIGRGAVKEAIEAASVNAPQCSPAPDRQAGDEKPGNHEECDDGVEPGPEQNPIERLWKHVLDGVLAQRKSQVNVVQDHGKDAKPTQYVDAGEAMLSWYSALETRRFLHLYC